MTIKLETICRGSGRGYLELAFTGTSINEIRDMKAFYEAETTHEIVPCGIYRRDHGTDVWRNAETVRLVIVFPLLDETNCVIRVVGGNNPENVLWQRRFSPLQLKMISRMTYRTKPEAAYGIRDIDSWRTLDCRSARLLGVYKAGNGMLAVRINVLFPFSEQTTYQTRVLDQSGSALQSRVMCLEDSVVPGELNRSSRYRSLSYSVLVHKDCRTICVVVQQGNDPSQSAFVCLLPDMVNESLRSTKDELRHASLDPGYDDWFRRRRASLEDVRVQQDIVKAWEDRPLISLVCVLFRTPTAYLHDLIRSVLAQSYDRFELVLVNVSGERPSVDDTLAQYGDDRIRVIAADNVSIADNTNIGIRAAHGEYVAFLDHDDVIEPDTLYHYAMVLREHPNSDLLYCDEDKLVGDHYEWPVFKPAFNRDLLYSYNYITHMLMVSRRVMESVELSPTDVSGAQDYDLSLKCVEHAREIHNVPYMLYHWREHPGSTSANADSKPYAVEAGRLALERHFERRGIPASVESRPEMFRYRVRYQHAGLPKVSVIIPTKDHADLLSTCIDSVMQKTTYQNYEIIVVENNSIEPETFANYERIEGAYDCVRVVRWPGRGFNYSAICNFGAQYADGEILLFLNNDTEVIAPGWMTSMAELFARPEVGVVGAKLLYRDGLVQHGGVWVSPGGCDYINQRCGSNDLGYMETLTSPFDCAAITGACQMIRHSIFEEIGGFDETLDVVLNDVDLCMRSNSKGYVTVFNPDAVLYHNEFSSRGRDERDPVKEARAVGEQMMFFDRWAKVLLEDRGRFLNRNLDQYNGHFKIRK